MDGEENWDLLLRGHPIFSPPLSVSHASGRGDISLELSLSSLPDFSDLDPDNDAPTPSGRRQVMVIKDSDLIVAAGSEIRMTSLADFKLARNTRKSYKILHTPNVAFDVHQMALNPNSKLLAIAGAFQVAVIVLPRSGFTKLVPATIDCKSVQVGQFYHATKTSSPVAKIEWHPWGEGGSTLMVMTVDGQLREYDISVDAEEPQQILSFVPQRKKNTIFGTDPSEREVASFSLGKGRADWGPLTVYAAMRSGDVFAICPYMPKNASIPSSYVHALECFVAAKLEYLSKSRQEGSSSDSMAMIYDYQHRYVTALLKQLPPGTSFPATPRFISMHPPTTIKNTPMRRGPFLLQPSPRNLVGSEGGNATDIVYVSFGVDPEDSNEGDMERLGIVLVSFQDGKVDVYLDVEKIEAQWDHKQSSSADLPMFAVYETIDLGLVSAISKAKSEPSLLDLLQANHPVIYPDPIHEDSIYVYHAFGVHALQLKPLLKSLTVALRGADDKDTGSLSDVLQSSKCTEVRPILTTFSVEQKSTSPIVGVSIPCDVYLTYSIFVLTAAMRISVFPLLLSEDDFSETPEVSTKPEPKLLLALEGPTAYVSLLGKEPFATPAILSRPASLPSHPRLSLPASAIKSEFMVTADTLRYFATTAEFLTGQMQEVEAAHRASEARAELQFNEFARQRETCLQMLNIIERIKGRRRAEMKQRMERLHEAQKKLSARLDRTLQSLMEKASPELSVHETKWFEELRGMKQEVVGASKFDSRSLTVRAKVLQREVDRLLPNLKEIKEREMERRRNTSENRDVLGLSQAFELGEHSSAERARIGDLEDDILKLAAQLDITLGRPPPQQKTLVS
ncbi:hypothetical protein BKA93DRAFT_876721 [Sparassis latifolia]